jgi:protein-arginine kinase activator protein McsA
MRHHGCEVCGKPATIHLTEITDGRERERMFCPKHAPPDVRAKMVELERQMQSPKPHKDAD